MVKIGLISAILGSFLWLLMMEMLEFDSTLVLQNRLLKQLMYILLGINIGYILVDCTFFWNKDHFDIKFNGITVLILLVLTFAIFILEQLHFLARRILQFRTLSLNTSIINLSPQFIIFYLASMIIAFLTAILYVIGIIRSSYFDWVLIAIFSELVFCYLLFKVPLLFLTTEQPAVLLILSNAGTSLYTNMFDSSLTFSDQLLGAYLNAIDILGSNILTDSGSVNSIKFQEKFNVAIKKVSFADSAIKFCYIYKGISYYAPQRLNKFIDLVSKDFELSNKIQTYLVRNQIFSNLKEFDGIIARCFSMNANLLEVI